MWVVSHPKEPSIATIISIYQEMIKWMSSKLIGAVANGR
jgi:hypothetical protein